MSTVLFPYPTLKSAPLLLVTATEVDGQLAKDLPDETIVDLGRLPEGWRHLRVTLSMSCDAAEVRDLGVEDLKTVATLQCQKSNLRYGVPLARRGQGGSWTGAIDIPAGYVAGTAEITASLSAEVATRPHRLLGRSTPVTVVTHATEALKRQLKRVPGRGQGAAGGAELLQVKWANFSTDENLQQVIDTTFRDGAVYVDITAEPPVVYLNDAVPGLRSLLREGLRRSAGEDALRRTFLDTIAASAWVALFSAAASDVRADDTQPEMPSSLWKQEVLRTLLPIVFADAGEDESLRRLRDAREGGFDADQLCSRVHAAALKHLKSTTRLRTLIDRLEKEPTDTAEDL